MSKPKLAVIVDGNLAAAGPGDKNNIDGLGTAATRDVGTTSGNVMQVGAFGLGGNMAPGSDTDPNPTGFYYNLANAQAHGSGAFFLDVKYASGNYSAFRLSTDVYSNNIYWQRGLGGGNYGLGTPVMFIHTGNTLSTTGQSTKYPMTQKAVTDALDNIDVSGPRPTKDHGAVATAGSQTVVCNVQESDFHIMSMQSADATGTLTIDFANMPNTVGKHFSWHVRLRRGGRKAVAFAQTVTWAGNVTPSFGTRASSHDLIMFYKVDNETIRGMVVDAW